MNRNVSDFGEGGEERSGQDSAGRQSEQQAVPESLWGKPHNYNELIIQLK